MIKSQKNTTKRTLASLGFLLGILFLLSPCTIRNSLQGVLGLEIQKTFHKGKTTFQPNNNCNVQINKTDVAKITKEKKQLNYPETTLCLYNFNIPVLERFIFPISASNHSWKTTVPLYILYKKWKYFIELIFQLA